MRTLLAVILAIVLIGCGGEDFRVNDSTKYGIIKKKETISVFYNCGPTERYYTIRINSSRNEAWDIGIINDVKWHEVGDTVYFR